ncbi:MAG TPA: phosphoribosylformylglycinamidine synthase I [Candidatus Nanoarchaeia archaeon]|nr:phosphoribosylformylglycinamidine synthase I [Candidatus Nanoarchaeia archaeon]
MRPKVLVLTGYGVNCDEETQFVFNRVGAQAEIVHINDLIDGRKKLKDYQILAFPGGFSYGDDTGSGIALANKIRDNIWKDVEAFVKKDNLVIGICNGFQVLVNLGLLPALQFKYGTRQAALSHNDSARYIDRWVDLEVTGKGPWLKGLKKMSVPIAHGEGKFFCEPKVLKELKAKKLIAFKYVNGEMCNYQNLPVNPNGALENIAGITDESGRVLGLMPHPERAMDFTQLPNWPWLKEKLQREKKPLPKEGPGLQLFKNAVSYFGGVESV